MWHHNLAEAMWQVTKEHFHLCKKSPCVFFTKQQQVNMLSKITIWSMQFMSTEADPTTYTKQLSIFNKQSFLPVETQIYT